MKWVMWCLLLLPASAFAHVKWFSEYAFNQKPLNLVDLSSPTFWGLFALSLISLPLLVWTDKKSENSKVYKATEDFLDRYAHQTNLIVRIAMGAVLLMSWQGDSYIAPELSLPNPVWGWIQFFMALLLLFRQTTFITGFMMLVLYGLGISQYGFFHLLDYVIYPAVGIYLIVCYAKNEKIKNLDLPVLYSGLGFSLCWVAFEKLIYPFWGLEVLSKQPALTMGLPHDFFLMSCAFIEFTLGYLLIICLLHRPLAIVVTLVFFTTTCFFGKTEVVGHTILHGALLVFILRGPGHYYQAPIKFHKSLTFRSLFAMVNFILLFGIMAYPYDKLSNNIYEKNKRNAMSHEKVVLTSESLSPSVVIHAKKDLVGGWNLHFEVTNFKFTPQKVGLEDIMNEGHAHLYVNGVKVARVYSEWFHLSLPKGENKIRVSLNTNGHKDYYINEKPVAYELVIQEEREGTNSHHH